MNVERRRAPTAPRDRFLLETLPSSERQTGWVDGSIGKRLPATASPEYRDGWLEAHSYIGSKLTAF